MFPTAVIARFISLKKKTKKSYREEAFQEMTKMKRLIIITIIIQILSAFF